MDLRLFAEVMWRQRRLLAAGAVVAVLVSLASMFSFSPSNGFEHRQEETWVSHARLLVTQEGFPQGRANLGQEDAGQQPDAGERRFLGTDRAVHLALLYAKIANADQVRSLMFDAGRVPGAKQVTVRAEQDLPTLDVEALATTRAAAVTLAQRQVRALLGYLQRRQATSGVPEQERVRLSIVRWPGTRPVLEEDSTTWLLAPRSKMLPMVVFLAVLALFAGLAFVVENGRRARVERGPVPIADPDVGLASEPDVKPVARSA